MEANDDELDKLIKETQDIWKSLKTSGVELRDSQVEESNGINSPNLDNLDQIASKLGHTSSNLNISNMNNTSITNEDEIDGASRTLQGLNLATPTNELSSFLLSAEPSKLSQIRFSTPNYKKTTNHIAGFNQDDSTSIPDTPFFISPTVPVRDVHANINDTIGTNFTLSSPPKQSQPQQKEQEEEKRQILQIDVE